jgi:hypothetical protein
LPPSSQAAGHAREEQSWEGKTASKAPSASQQAKRLRFRKSWAIWLIAVVLLSAVGQWCYFNYFTDDKRADDSDRSILSFTEALALKTEAEQSKNLAAAKIRLLDKKVVWRGFVVEATLYGYIIQPREEERLDGRERAFVGLRNPNERPAFRKGERVRVSGKVSRFDAEGINISGATIVED